MYYTAWQSPKPDRRDRCYYFQGYEQLTWTLPHRLAAPPIAGAVSCRLPLRNRNVDNTYSACKFACRLVALRANVCCDGRLAGVAAHGCRQAYIGSLQAIPDRFDIIHEFSRYLIDMDAGRCRTAVAALGAH